MIRAKGQQLSAAEGGQNSQAYLENEGSDSRSDSVWFDPVQSYPTLRVNVSSKKALSPVIRALSLSELKLHQRRLSNVSCVECDYPLKDYYGDKTLVQARQAWSDCTNKALSETSLSLQL